MRGDVQIARRENSETRGLESSPQTFWRADGKPPALVEGRRLRIDRERNVPKFPQETHFAGVVPNVCGDGSSRTSNAVHFPQCSDGVGNIVQSQARDAQIELLAAEGERYGISEIECGGGMRALLARELYLGR